MDRKAAKAHSQHQQPRLLMVRDLTTPNLSGRSGELGVAVEQCNHVQLFIAVFFPFLPEFRPLFS